MPFEKELPRTQPHHIGEIRYTLVQRYVSGAPDPTPEAVIEFEVMDITHEVLRRRTENLVPHLTNAQKIWLRDNLFLDIRTRLDAEIKP